VLSQNKREPNALRQSLPRPRVKRVRSRVQKRVVQKPDGRYLIYFEKS
jgi:hypothetical protein